MKTKNILCALTLIPYASYIYALIFALIYINIFKMFGFNITRYIFIIAISLSITPVIITTWVKLALNTNFPQYLKLIISIAITSFIYLLFVQFKFELIKISLLPFMYISILNWLASKINYNYIDGKIITQIKVLILVFPLIINIVILFLLIIALSVNNIVFNQTKTIISHHFSIRFKFLPQN